MGYKYGRIAVMPIIVTNRLDKSNVSAMPVWWAPYPTLVSSISDASKQVHVSAHGGGIVSFRSKSQFVDFLVIMSPRISSPATAPRSTGLTHPCPHDDHVKSRSIREELRNRRKMPSRHFSPEQALIAGGGPRVRTRAGRGCRSHGLCRVSRADRGWLDGSLRTSALDVTDDRTGLVVHELDTALGDTTTGAYIAVSLDFLQFLII